jgi:ABC-2 type transport system ATP-binding protein
VATLLTAADIRVEFGTLVAVRDVSLEIDGGQLVGLVGPNGAGKTTLLRVLAGLHAPTHGSASIMGKPVLGEHEIVRQHVGFAPDTPPAYEELAILQFLQFIATAYDLSRQEASERIDFWLDRLWLTDKADTLIKHLSRGMLQRVVLARTLIPRPHVILLDEPLAGLDPTGRVQLRGVLGMLREQGCGMIVSSHILSDLEEVATHIAIIEQGSIIRFSETDALRHGEKERRAYRLVIADHRADVARLLAAVEGITDIRQDGSSYTFDYDGDRQKAADLLKRLIEMNLPVASFFVLKASLEEAYLRTGVKQVD